MNLKSLFKTLIFTFLFSFCYSVTAQNSGIVQDSENQPIDNVSVFIADQNILLKTNKLGEFFFESKLPNNTYLNFYKNGYVSKLVKYKEGSDFKVFLKKLHVALDEVGVVESYSELGNTKLTNIDKKSLENVFLRDNSMVESITQLSGVDIVSSGLGIQKVVVRGLSGMRVVTYLNGMQINNQQWANDHGIGFTELGLGEVELIKGSSALKYGSRHILHTLDIYTYRIVWCKSKQRRINSKWKLIYRIRINHTRINRMTSIPYINWCCNCK